MTQSQPCDEMSWNGLSRQTHMTACDPTPSTSVAPLSPRLTSEQDPLLSPSECLTWRRLQLQEQKTMKWCSLLSADSGWVAVKERVGRWQEGRTRRREKKECERVNKEAAEEGTCFKQCDKRDEKWEWKATDTGACTWLLEKIEPFHVCTSVSGINDFRGLSSVLSLDRIKAFAFSLWLSVNGTKTCQFRTS